MDTNNGTRPPLLAPVGLSEVEEKVYRSLLRRDGASLEQVIESTALSERRARQTLGSLQEIGLVARSTLRPKDYLPAPPEAALEMMILRRQEELEQTRLAVRQLRAEVAIESQHDESAGLVELIPAGEGVNARNYQLLMAAQHEILGVCVPPLAPPDEAFIEFKLKILKRGVTARVVYPPEVLQGPDGPAHIRFIEAVRRAGEEPRLLRDPPMFLLIVDRELAFLPAHPDKAGIEHDHLVVHPSSLMQSLLSMFETLWERAIPFEPGGRIDDPGPWTAAAALSAEERRVLGLLGAGLQDTAIAAQMGIAPRTVQRHVKRIMDLLGTTTRFQAGLQACQRGMLGHPEPAGDRPPRAEPGVDA